MILTDEKSSQIADRIRDAVEAALRDRKVSARRASIDVVGNDGLIRDIRAGRIPSVDRIQALFDYLGIELYFGPPRDTGPFEQVILDGHTYAHIPLHEAALSAGPGTTNGNALKIDHLAFRRDWLQRIGVSPARACLAIVERDSMVPTMFPGDMVLIDRSHTEPPMRRRGIHDKRRAPIYAFVEDGQARVKRIERPESGIVLLVSDNPDFPPEVRTGAQIEQLQMAIIGKVVWWGHTDRD